MLTNRVISEQNEIYYGKNTMKTCPVCHAQVFDDMKICFGCMHHFSDDSNKNDNQPDKQETQTETLFVERFFDKQASSARVDATPAQIDPISPRVDATPAQIDTTFASTNESLGVLLSALSAQKKTAYISFGQAFTCAITLDFFVNKANTE